MPATFNQGIATQHYVANNTNNVVNNDTYVEYVLQHQLTAHKLATVKTVKLADHTQYAISEYINASVSINTYCEVIQLKVMPLKVATGC